MNDTPLRPGGPRPDHRSRLALWLWLVAASFILYAALIPFNLTRDRAIIDANRSRVTLNPFISPDTGRRVSLPDAAQNVLLFVPFGMIGYVALGRRAAPGALRVAVVTLSGAFLSASVEALQLFTTDRTTSISDLAANTVGTAGGAVAARLAFIATRRGLARLRLLGVVDVPAFYPMAVALGTAVIAAWEPFDFSLDVGSLMKIRALSSDPWQFTGVTDEGGALIIYVLLGLATTSWLRQLRVARSTTRGAAVSAAVAVGLEASQWFVASRMPGLEDALVRSAAAIAGAAMANGWPHGLSPWFWTTLLVVATGVAAALEQLAPFVLATSPRAVTLFPFVQYYERTSLQTVSHVVELVLLYAPLGFVLAWAVGRRQRLWWMAAALTLGLAVPIEIGQGWIDGRFPDLTDIGVSVLGAILGAWLCTVGPPERPSTEAGAGPQNDGS